MFLRITALVSALIVTAACSEKSFTETIRSCEAPPTSARFNTNPGPIILSPIAGAYAPGAVTVEGTCVDGKKVIIEEVSGRKTEVDCNSSTFSTQLTLSDSDGIKDLMVSQNTSGDGSPVVDRLCVTKDTVPPLVEITNQTGSQSTSNSSSIVTGRCEAGLQVTVTGPGIQNPVQTDCNGGTFSVAVQLTGTDGLKDVRATQIDPAGNAGNDTTNYIVDSTPPIVRIMTPSALTMTRNSIALTGVCESGLRVTVGDIGSANMVNTDCLSGAFSVTVPVDGADGMKNIKVVQIDAAGNIGRDARNFIKDATPPAIAINLPAENSYLTGSTTFSGSCETGLQVQLSGSVLVAAQTVACNASAWTLTTAISPGQGTKALQAQQTDAAGNVGQAARNYMVDTIAPVLTFTSPAANSYVGAVFVIQGTCETGLPVSLTGAGLAAPVTAVCSSNLFMANVTSSAGDGVKAVTISQTDGAGNTGSASRNFNKDLTGPNLAITAPAENSYVGATFTLQGTCEAGLAVAISGTGIAAPATATCTGGGTFSSNLTTSAGDGVKLVSVAQTDVAGNTSAASRNFLRDTTAPVVTIAAPAANSYLPDSFNLQGTCETGLNVSVSGTGIAAPATTACAAGVYTVALAPSAGDGTKAITVSQTDAAGNVGTASRSFLRDTSGPNLTITAPAANSYLGATFTLQGACETGLAISISGDAIAAPTTATCLGSSYSVLLTTSAGDGVKNIAVSQTDAFGNIGQASRAFQRDTTAPLVTISAPAENAFLAANSTFTGTCETGIQVQLSGSVLATPQSVACNASAWTLTTNIAVGEGTRVLQAAQTDAAGNVGTANRNYQVDTQPPALTFTSPAANSYVAATFQVQGTCETGLNVTIAGAGIAAPVTAACAAATFTGTVTTSAGDGTKNVTLSQTDAAGNTGTANRNFLRDTTAPVLAITAPAANSFVSTTFNLQGTCETGLTVAITGTGISAPATANCTGGNFSTVLTTSAGDGAKAVTITQTDAAGNSASDSRSFIRDATAPTVTIASPNANSYLSSPFTLQGACEVGLMVNISGGGLDVPAMAVCAAGTYSVSLTPSAGDGTKNIIASQTDAAGNIGTANRSFLRDTTAPVLTITSPAANSYVGATFTLQGACETGLTVSISGTAIDTPVTATCNASAYSVLLTTSVGDGVKTVNLQQTDAAGNIGTATRNFLRDTVAPAVTIASPADNAFLTPTSTFTGTCETGIQVQLSGSVLSAPQTVACNASAWTLTTAIAVGQGTRVLQAQQTDAAGNVGQAVRNYQVDTLPPALAFTSPAANSYVAADFQVQGTCEAGLTVTVSGSGLNAPVGATCAAGTFTASVSASGGDGTKVVMISQTDAAGNTGTASRTFLRDTTAPNLTITSPVNGAYVSNTFNLQGTCEAGLTVSLSGAGLSTSSTTSCAAGTFSVNLTTSAGDGTKVVTASQTDGAGNVGSVTNSYVKDSTAPVIAITAPAAGAYLPAVFALEGTCETGLTVSVSGSGLSAATTTSCVAGIFSVNVSPSAGDGTKAVSVSQTDAAGNTGSNSRSFLRDTTAPVLSITAPAANAFVGATFTLQGTCETGLLVSITGAGVDPATTAACTGSVFSVSVTTSPGDGVKAVTVSQTDAAGNTGSANRSFQRDTVAPSITITAPVNGSDVPQTIALRGACETGLTVTVTGNVTATATGACTASAYNINVQLTNGYGSRTVTARQTDAAGNIGQATATYTRSSTNGFETFMTDSSFGKIDILFVDDNSASMETEQAALGTRFPSFSAELQGVDWQMGITTTDCSAGTYGICGSLLPMVGGGGNILTPLVPNYEQVFNNTIQRPETPNCSLLGTCPAGFEEPLRASMTAMDKRATDNAGFFRTDADLAIVILSDEDEGSNGPASVTGRPAQLMSHFSSTFGSTKQLRVYGIVIKPGDAACLSQQAAQAGGFAFYGNLLEQAVNLSGGLSLSVCAPDYSTTLKTIGESVRTLTNSVELAQTPVAGTVSVNFVPAQSITFIVIGRKVVFDTPPAPGTQIQVSYSY